MKFFENARVGKNHWLLYVAMLIVGYIVAQIPATIYIVALIAEKMANGDRQAMRAMFGDGNMDAFFDTIPGFIALMLTFLAWMGGTWGFFKLFHHRERMTLISGEKKLRKKNFFWGVLILGAIMLLSLGIEISITPDDYKFSFQGSKYILFFVLCILLVPFQTGCEELIFRGYLMQGFALCTKSKVWALVITSVMFGLMHCANNEVIQYGFFKTIPLYILIGLQMGFFAILSDGIEFSWGMHFINNFIAFTIISTEGGTLSGNALFMTKREAVSVTDYIVIIAEFALIYFLLRKKMGWDIKKAFDNSGLKNNVPPPYFA